MSKTKRTTKPTPKKDKQTKNNNESLAHLLLAKYQNCTKISIDLNSQKALILETVLSGTDEQLSQLLQQTQNGQQIEIVVGSWVQSSATQLINRLLSLLENNDYLWVYPWLKAAISRAGILKQEHNTKIKSHLQAQQQHNLDDVLRLSGKLDLFDF